jgi:hypothetical protein
MLRPLAITAIVLTASLAMPAEARTRAEAIADAKKVSKEKLEQCKSIGGVFDATAPNGCREHGGDARAMAMPTTWWSAVLDILRALAGQSR